MSENLQIFFDLLIQFTGDGGGHRPGIVPYGLAGLFWLGLLLISRFQYKREPDAHLWLLQWGFAAGLARQLFMLSVKLLEAYSIVSIDTLHIFFPPLEHALSDGAEVLIASGYMLYLTKKPWLSTCFMRVGLVAVGVCYFATFYWWGGYIQANPSSKFGQTWCDWVFRINASALLAFAIWSIWRNTKGQTRKLVCFALGCFFLDDFLKLPDMAMGEKHEAVFAPIRHGLALIAVPVLAFVFIREQAMSIRESFECLEVIIEERTAELKVASEKLQGALERQIQFTADASHELRTPLTVILNESEWVQERERDQDIYQKSFMICQDAARHMSGLVENLLELARVDSGGLKLSKSKVSIDHLCIETARMMQSVALAKGVEVQMTSAGSNIVAEIDLMKIRQVLINLLNNAINHSEAGSTVMLHLKKIEGRLVISVEDQGVGIPLADIGSIFDRFYQSDQSRSEKGTGLGLAVSQSIAMSHGGGINVESELGKGSLFTLDIPLGDEKVTLC